MKPRLLVALVAAVAALAPASASLAHAPNPLLGTHPYGQDQILGYQWAKGGVPPAWMAAAIDAGAQDVEDSRNSRAALFTRVASADSEIFYGNAVPCSSYGIACMNRTGAPDSFAGMWFRPHGWPFDWGQLRWCQGMAQPTNGCYDAENVALDEFGHIEILGHHVNFEDESDYLDSVVQFAPRTRPRIGWNEHVFGRCDVARLQLEYELEAPGDPVSTCLALGTKVSIVPGATSISPGQAVRVTGTLNVITSTAAKAMSGDPLSNRTLLLQRRPPGSGIAWATVGTLAPNGVAGSYGLTIVPPASYDYRILFTPANEGLNSSWSTTVRVMVTACSTSGGQAGARSGPVPYVPCE